MIRRFIIFIPVLLFFIALPSFGLSYVDAVPAQILKEDIPWLLDELAKEEVLPQQVLMLSTVIDEPGVVEGFLDILEGENPAAKANVALLIGRISDPPIQLLPLLIDSMDGMPQKYIDLFPAAFINYGPRAAAYLDELRTHLITDDEKLTARFPDVVTAMGREGAPAIPDLVDLLSRGGSYIPRNAVRAIGKFGPLAVDYLPVLAETCGTTWGYPSMDEYDPFLLIGEQSIPYLVEMVTSAEYSRRNYARKTLVKFGPMVEDALIKALNNDPETVGYLALTLTDIGSRNIAVVEYLIRDLNSDLKEVARSAAQALGTIGPDAGAAIPTLIILSRDYKSQIKYDAERAIEQIGLINATDVNAITDLLDHENYSVRIDAITTLGLMDIEGAEIRDRLIPMLQEKNSTVQKSAFRAISKTFTTDELIQFYRGSDNLKVSAIQLTLMEILEERETDSTEAIKLIIDFFDNPSSSIVTAAKNALVKIGTPSLNLLADSLDSPTLKKQTAAAETILVFGADAVDILDSLIEALDGPPEVRIPIVKTLGFIGPDAAAALPKLREIAENDQYVNRRHMTYPAREAAREAIEKIESGEEE